MPKNSLKTLESGKIYFFYKLKDEKKEANSSDDIARLYLFMNPSEKRLFRMIIIGRKQLPDPKSEENKFFAFVYKTSRKTREIPEKVKDESKFNIPKDRVVFSAKPVGEGKYVIVLHEDHTHLIYELTLPSKMKHLQDMLNLQRKANYILSVKNPDKSSPEYAAVDEEFEANYPEHLQQEFEGNRFVMADPVDLLDFKGSQLLLIAVPKAESKALFQALDTSGYIRA